MKNGFFPLELYPKAIYRQFNCRFIFCVTVRRAKSKEMPQNKTISRVNKITFSIAEEK